MPKRLVALILSLVLAGCSLPVPAPPVTATPTPLATAAAVAFQLPTATLEPSPSPSATEIPTATQTATVTTTPTETPTPTVTETPTITPTPTFDFPDGIIKEAQAFCRYGPGKAYLHAHGFYQGDHVEIHGRSSSGTWLYVKPDPIAYHCWAAASVMDITGDIHTVIVQPVRLPKTTFAGPPPNVGARRDGDQVTISWDLVPLSEDKNRGYLLEVNICQNGAFFWMAVQSYETSYTFTDQPGCAVSSGGKLYTAEKHGYSDPVDIPWP
jgi:hypothetical protein